MPAMQLQALFALRDLREILLMERRLDGDAP